MDQTNYVHYCVLGGDTSDGKRGVRVVEVPESWQDGSTVMVDGDVTVDIYAVKRGSNITWPSVGGVVRLERTDKGVRAPAKLIGYVEVCSLVLQQPQKKQCTKKHVH